MTTFAAALGRRESRSVRWVRRASLVIAGLYALCFVWSNFRRLYQVLRIEVRAESRVLAPGAVVGYDVITSGEVQNLIVLELVQGAHRTVLVEQRAYRPPYNGLDVRVFRYTPSVTLTTAHLAPFRPGPAVLRVTGYGGMKLLRTPAPRVRELPVQLRS